MREFRGKSLTWGITISCGAGFFLFGYDQGVFGGILTNQNFLDTFNNPNSTIQAQITSTYYLGKRTTKDQHTKALIESTLAAAFRVAIIKCVHNTDVQKSLSPIA